MAQLTGNPINTSYQGILKTLDNAAINGTNRVISDGVGNALPLEASTTTIKFTGNADFTSATVTGIAAGGLVSGTGTNSLQSGIPGATSNASSTNSIAIGVDASMSGGFGAAIGVYSEAGGNYANAFGSLCNASGVNSLAVGKQATASGDAAISIGIENSATAPTSVVIGKSSSCASGQDGGIVIGNLSNVKYKGISIGNNINNYSASQGIAIGQGAGTGNGYYATALGYNAKANAQGSVALGFGVTAATADTVTIKKLQMLDYATLNYADDAAAATGGIPLGGVYHASGALKIRIA